MGPGRAIFAGAVGGRGSFFGGVPVFRLAAGMQREKRGAENRLQGDFGGVLEKSP